MEGYKFSIPYVVRVADINYGGHVANSAVLNFFQDARIAFLDKMGGYSEMDVGNGCGIIMPEANIKYRAEMFLGDQLEIGVRVSKVGRSSFTIEYRIERDEEVMVEGTTAVVCFDYNKRRPRRVGDDLRTKLEAFENK